MSEKFKVGDFVVPVSREQAHQNIFHITKVIDDGGSGKYDCHHLFSVYLNFDQDAEENEIFSGVDLEPADPAVILSGLSVAVDSNDWLRAINPPDDKGEDFKAKKSLFMYNFTEGGKSPRMGLDFRIFDGIPTLQELVLLDSSLDDEGEFRPSKVGLDEVLLDADNILFEGLDRWHGNTKLIFMNDAMLQFVKSGMIKGR